MVTKTSPDCMFTQVNAETQCIETAGVNMPVKIGAPQNPFGDDVSIFLPVRSTACQSSFRCEAPRANLPSGAKHRVLCIGHFAQQHLPFGDDADAEFGWIAKPCVIEMGECSHSASEKAAAIVPASLRANFMKPASV